MSEHTAASPRYEVWAPGVPFGSDLYDTYTTLPEARRVAADLAGSFIFDVELERRV